MPGRLAGHDARDAPRPVHERAAHDRRHRRPGADHRDDEPTRSSRVRPSSRAAARRCGSRAAPTSSRPRRGTARDGTSTRSCCAAGPSGRGDERARRPPRSPDVAWIEPGLAARHARSRQSHPSWLVLNQSFSRGWQASVDGHDLGAPVLLDGGFTAWRLGATPKGATVAITWAPQRTVDLALLASLLGLLVVIACIVLGARRRRPHAVAPASGPRTSRRSRGRGASAPRRRSCSPPSRPSWPWRSPGPPSRSSSSRCWPSRGGARRCASPSRSGPRRCSASSGCTSSTGSGKYGWPHNIQWPTHFGLANTLAWIAVALLLVDVAAYGFGGPAEAAPAPAPSTPPPSDAVPGPATTAAAGAAPSTTAEAGAARTTTDGAGLARVIPTRLLSSAAAFVSSRFSSDDDDDHRPDGPLIALPASGLARSFALLRAFGKEQDDPDLFYRTMALDTLHRLTGSAPLFNRTVIDVGGGAGYFAEAFRDAGRARRARRARGVRTRSPTRPTPTTRRSTRASATSGRSGRGASSRARRWPATGSPCRCPTTVRTSSSPRTSSSTSRTRRGSSTRRCASRGPGARCTSRSRCGARRGAATRPRRGTRSRGGYALRRYTKKHGHPPKNVFGESLFAVRAGTSAQARRRRATTSRSSPPSPATTRRGPGGSCTCRWSASSSPGTWSCSSRSSDCHSAGAGCGTRRRALRPGVEERRAPRRSSAR